MPFTSDYMNDHIPVVYDEDLKQFNLFSEESLLKRYKDAREHVKSASPPKQNKGPMNEEALNAGENQKQ